MGNADGLSRQDWDEKEESQPCVYQTGRTGVVLAGDPVGLEKRRGSSRKREEKRLNVCICVSRIVFHGCSAPELESKPPHPRVELGSRRA